jgi:hypothetical protein
MNSYKRKVNVMDFTFILLTEAKGVMDIRFRITDRLSTVVTLTLWTPVATLRTTMFSVTGYLSRYSDSLRGENSADRISGEGRISTLVHTVPGVGGGGTQPAGLSLGGAPSPLYRVPIERPKSDVDRQPPSITHVKERVWALFYSTSGPTPSTKVWPFTWLQYATAKHKPSFANKHYRRLSYYTA